MVLGAKHRQRRLTPVTGTWCGPVRTRTMAFPCRSIRRLAFAKGRPNGASQPGLPSMLSSTKHSATTAMATSGRDQSGRFGTNSGRIWRKSGQNLPDTGRTRPDWTCVQRKVKTKRGKRHQGRKSPATGPRGGRDQGRAEEAVRPPVAARRQRRRWAAREAGTTARQEGHTHFCFCLACARARGGR